jgi:hypothetical protein
MTQPHFRIQDACAQPASELSYAQIGDMAKTGSVQDVENLLRGHGDKTCLRGMRSFNTLSTETCLRAIIDGINYGVVDTDKIKAQKLSLVIDYTSKTGVFSKNAGTIDADTAKEFRQNIADLTARVDQLTKAVEKLSKTTTPKAPQ